MEYEFDLAVKAKNGDLGARDALWSKYRTLCMMIVGKVRHLEEHEKLAEAFIWFCDRLEYFDPSKVRVPPSSWSFNFMLLNYVKNQSVKMIHKMKKYYEHEVSEYIEDEEEYTNHNGMYIGDTNSFNFQMFGSHVYDVYNPEKIAIRNLEESLDSRAERFFAQLTAMQRYILAERRAGRKLQEIADELGVHLNTVNRKLREAKALANTILLGASS